VSWLRQLREAHAVRALRSANFRLFFAGQGISVIGTWMTRLATSWLVYRLTGSVLMLGVVSFAGQSVSFVLGPVAGVWVDRWERRRLLVMTQAAASLQALLLAALALAHVARMWELIALTVAQGVINAFDMPARQAFLVEMVDEREDLANAIALNSLLANGGRLAGPALAGAVIAMAGEGWCFLIDGLSYLAVIASLLLMHVCPRERKPQHKGLWDEVSAGWQYVSARGGIRTILLVFALFSLLGYSFTVLLPAIARETLHGGAQTLGWLSAAAGVGTMLSTLLLTMRRTALGLPRALLWSAWMQSVALLLLGASHTLWLSLLAVALAGYGLMQGASACNTILQSLVSEGKRTQVMSYYTMAFFGGAPLGSLLLGALAARMGSSAALLLCGVASAVGALWYGLQRGEVQRALESAVSTSPAVRKNLEETA
jgi:MFS family permease